MIRVDPQPQNAKRREHGQPNRDCQHTARTRARQSRDGLQWRQKVLLVRRLSRLGFHEREQRRHQDERDHEIDHDPDCRSHAERPHGHDVARREREHAERRRRARAKQWRRQVRDRRLERLFYTPVPPLLVPVLHDVHVVGNRQHDDERHEHARQDVEAETHQRVEAKSPEQADEHGKHRQQRLAPRPKGEVDRQHREEQDRWGELALVVERDAIVGLADLEAAVVVGADPSGQPWIDDVVDLLDDAGADLVDAILVEADDDRRRRAIFRDEVTANEVVLESAAADVSRVAGGEAVEQWTDVETAILGIAALQRLDDRRRGQAVDSLNGVDALDVAGDRLDRLQRVAGKQSIGRIGLERDDQRARAAKLRPKALVVAIDRVVLREPRGNVVVDLRDVRARRQGERANHDEDRQRKAPAIDPAGKRVTHLLMVLSSSRRLKSASFKPTL